MIDPVFITILFYSGLFYAIFKILFDESQPQSDRRRLRDTSDSEEYSLSNECDDDSNDEYSNESEESDLDDDVSDDVSDMDENVDMDFTINGPAVIHLKLSEKDVDRLLRTEMNSFAYECMDDELPFEFVYYNYFGDYYFIICDQTLEYTSLTHFPIIKDSLKSELDRKTKYTLRYDCFDDMNQLAEYFKKVVFNTAKRSMSFYLENNCETEENCDNMSFIELLEELYTQYDINWEKFSNDYRFGKWVTCGYEEDYLIDGFPVNEENIRAFKDFLDYIQEDEYTWESLAYDLRNYESLENDDENEIENPQPLYRNMPKPTHIIFSDSDDDEDEEEQSSNESYESEGEHNAFKNEEPRPDTPLVKVDMNGEKLVVISSEEN